MSKARCPGQDTRYWRPGDIFELKCGNCGKSIEFFKDDVSRICPECGERIQNPKISLGCAQWCEHAKECLGYDPEEALSEFNSAPPDSSLSDAILDELHTRFGEQSLVYIDAVKSLETIKTMMKGETADPGIVIPAALLLEADSSINTDKYRENENLSLSREILSDSGVSKNKIDEIVELIHAVHAGEKIDTAEYSMVEECYNRLRERVIN